MGKVLDSVSNIEKQEEEEEEEKEEEEEEKNPGCCGSHL